MTSVATTSGTPPGMALIPGGPFTMGDGNSDATPTVSVTVSAFYMDVNLVSYGQWKSVFKWAINHDYTFGVWSGDGTAANHPVVAVDWYSAMNWCNARSEQEGLTPVYYTDLDMKKVYRRGYYQWGPGSSKSADTCQNPYPNWAANGYRLPTEAEWEKAARGGLSGKRFPWGDTISQSQANYGLPTTPPSKTYNTSPVGSFAPNGYGLYDVIGNVSEWCWDWDCWNSNKSAYEGRSAYAGGTDPRGPLSGTYRVTRSSSWESYGAADCAKRGRQYPTIGSINIGFRCARAHRPHFWIWQRFRIMWRGVELYLNRRARP
jgi:formylglycine-generating enzyme required for sulfatase activity